MANAADPGAELERIVAARWRSGPHDPLPLSIAEWLRRGGGVAEIATRSGYIERQLRRRCVSAFGYGAKALGRILRLNAALDE